MNILIVGNGFDLSHYLPTKYTHFMQAMYAIYDNEDIIFKELENLDKTLKYIDDEKADAGSTITFDMLMVDFDKTFIDKTKEYYSTEQAYFEGKLAKKIKAQLRTNLWFNFLKADFKQVPNWIDLENEIKTVIQKITYIFKGFESNSYDQKIKEYLSDLEEFKIFNTRQQIRKVSKGIDEYGHSLGSVSKPYYAPSINSIYCTKRGEKYHFDAAISYKFLFKELENFIELFDIYLLSIIDKLTPKYKPNIPEKLRYLAGVYSFNYTNTLENLYKIDDVKHLHGVHGFKPSQIVLGVGDFDDSYINKNYGSNFYKSFQRALKNTDLYFFDNSEYLKQVVDQISEGGTGLQTNIVIWGHSLGESDKNYIQKLFSFNKHKDDEVRITICFHTEDKSSVPEYDAKNQILSQLFLFIDQSIVMKWMKNKWLTFEPNPEIDFGVQEESEPEQQAS